MNPADFTTPRIRNVGIIGGLGRMGRFLTRLFEGRGLGVEISDAFTGPVSDAFMARCQVIFISVPIPAVEPVIRDIGPRLSPDQLVVDITSIKAEPIRMMLEHCPGPVIGCHPLFGPREGGIERDLVFYCPVRPGQWLAWFKELWTGLGARLEEMDPEAHDKLMGTVQVLRQMMIYAFEKALIDLDFRPDRDLELSGPLFGQLIGLIDNQRSQDEALFANIALGNPCGLESFKAFAGAADDILKALESGNQEELISAIGPAWRQGVQDI